MSNLNLPYRLAMHKQSCHAPGEFVRLSFGAIDSHDLRVPAWPHTRDGFDLLAVKDLPGSGPSRRTAGVRIEGNVDPFLPPVFVNCTVQQHYILAQKAVP